MRTWSAFNTAVRALAFAPDGATLACASPVAGVKLFEVATGRERWHFNESSFDPQVAFTPDGEKLVALVKQRIAVLDVADGRELARHSRMLAGFAVPPEPNELLVVTSGMDTAEFRRLNLTDGAVLGKKVLQYHGGITRVELSPDAKTLGTVGAWEAMLIDVGTRKIRHAHRMKADDRRPPALTFAPDGATFVFAEKSTLHATNVDAQEQVRSTDFDGAFHDLAFRRDGCGLFALRGKSSVEELSAGTWEPLNVYDWKIGKLVRVAVSRDGAVAAAGSESGKVVVWDLSL